MKIYDKKTEQWVSVNNLTMSYYNKIVDELLEENKRLKIEINNLLELSEVGVYFTELV